MQIVNLKLIVITLLSCVLLGSAEMPINKSAEFAFSVKLKGNKVELDNVKNCNFNVLAFTANRSTLIDQNGMVAEEKGSTYKKSVFLVRYNKKGKTIILDGVKGVNWTQLKFSAETSRVVDQNGVN